MRQGHEGDPELRPRALVVDDFRDGRELAMEVLEGEGFEVHEASTGPEALQQVAALMPDLLVLDLALPGLDGWEIARRLRRSEPTRNIRILALTAHAERSALERARTAGCDAVLTKPCSPGELAQQARRLVDAEDPERNGEPDGDRRS